MTEFILACAVMVLAALALVAWPLLKSNKPVEGQPPQKHYVATIVLALAVPAIAWLFYANVGRMHWQQEIADSAQANSVTPADIAAMVVKLEKRLADAPDDITGWLMLGRSYVAMEKPPQALNAYQKAYDLSSGNNLDAAMGLGEAMIMVDERAFTGKAGELFEQVLEKEPDNAKALWYASIGALASGNLQRAHERLQRILTLNPPENIRSIIERQLQDIQQQLGAAGSSPTGSGATMPMATTSPSKATTSGRALKVQVTIDPKLGATVDQRTPLFVLARDPSAAGPPLAAVRRAVGDLPLSVTITDNDAMMQGRGIGSVKRVQVVARISKSGAPQAQPGDLYGEALVDFAGDKPVNVKILIDRVVSSAGGK